MHNNFGDASVMSYERSGGCALGQIYTIGLRLEEHTPLLLYIESLPNMLYVDL